ncbi:SEC23-interacting protein [Trichechus manatus latirostris]|uniref:SEC23-interacting protein n=1 Tax=Trichechus manatus latirostris TaxID=127582 RepID=A0A2Y9QWI7_TRIMA|nr:SEC23-interacting protein [Trichechus manatus latirostris]
MSERKPNGGSGGASTSSSGTNLLFSSSATEFSFNVPFIPVTQVAASPASLLLPGEDSTDVGEEDSFLGQTSAHTSTPQTFSYFSQVPSSGDPFGNIGQSPLTTATASVGQSPFSKPPAALPFTTGSQDVLNAFSPSVSKAQYGAPPMPQMGVNAYLPSQQSGLPPAHFGSPPPGAPQQGYNPYRHTPGSSRANPYITPPQLQQCQTPGHPTQLPPPGPPVQMYQMPPGALPPSPPSVQSALPPPAQQQVLARPAGPSVQAPPPFLLQNQYEPVQPHWFYCKEVECKQLWMPFSVYDSFNLEEIYNSVQPDPESVVLGTDGGRYDVHLYDRVRKPVYWEEEPAEVRRCTWFYKGDADSRFIPYTEEFSEKLEVRALYCFMRVHWSFVCCILKVIVQFQPSSVPDEWGTTQDGQTRPRVVKRGIDDSLDEIPHGVYSLFRTNVHLSFLLFSHHSLAKYFFFSFLNRNIKKITLPSIGRFRHFTNETLLDILFYNSPTYCQRIVEKVGMEINRLYALFMGRNPDFKGGVSVAGHSLGKTVKCAHFKHNFSEKIVESPDFSKDEDYLGKVGMLNGGRRIDYVLQEKPIESFNEYLFALQSHLCYWESEDTALLLLKEIYRTMNISPEQPQH